MDDIPVDFENLAAALDSPEPPGWSVGSSEGGWASRREIRKRWGTIADAVIEDSEPKPATSRLAKKNS